MEQLFVEHSANQVLLRFMSSKGSGPLLLTSSDVPGNRFRCDEIRAEFTDGELPEVSLHGVVDERVPYTGVLKQNTKSERDLLGYILYTLEKKDEAEGADLASTTSRIRNILGSIEYEIHETNHVLKDLLEICVSDFRWKRSRKKNQSEPGRVIEGSSDLFQISPKLSLFSGEKSSFSLPYDTISGFLAIELGGSETLDFPVPEMKPLAERLVFVSSRSVYGISNDGPVIQVPVKWTDSIEDASFFFHVGSRDNRAAPWVDYEARLLSLEEGSGLVSLSVESFDPGRYEYTCYAFSGKTREAVWMGSYGDNKSFIITQGQTLARSDTEPGSKTASVPLGSYESFSRWCKRKYESGCTGSLLEPLFSNEETRGILAKYYEVALRRLAKRKGSASQSVVRMFRTLGLSNVVMVTPEGPHAIAGGLAQVIVGLSEVFCHEGLEVTLISPLYEDACGNHHVSFATAISEGISVFGDHVFPRLQGEFTIDIPPTCWTANHGIATPRRVLKVEVYEIKVRSIRMLFLRHKTLGDRLYGGISAKDQIQRSVFLSRGALEVCRKPEFDIAPGVIISHDWLPSLVTPLLKLDPVYARDERLARFASIHMLHNVGKAYQGRFPVSEHGESLWPLLGLSMDHLYGFLDEEHPDHLNFTKGCCFHNSNAILTVSKPYADQLLQEDSGEGLARILQDKRDILFGISNGIPQESVRAAGFARAISPEYSDISVESVSRCKRNLKKLVQKENNLIVDDRAVLGVFVGRLTEQKGLGLLSSVLPNGLSVVENALIQYPDFQLLVAGPPSRFDPSYIEFERFFMDLQKKYPGRCAGRFEFVPHKYAIEFTSAADMFLMPSRYEPGGITQLEALAVGTTVVAHRVGGLSATLSPFKTTSGNSFLFERFTQEAFWDSLQSANEVLGTEEGRNILIERALKARNGWEHRVPYYLSLFQKVLGIFDIFSTASTTFSSNRLDLLSRISAQSTPS
jgi:starch synthase